MLKTPQERATVAQELQNYLNEIQRMSPDELVRRDALGEFHFGNGQRALEALRRLFMDWGEPLGRDTNQADAAAASCCSNSLGGRYPSEECSRFSL